MTMFRLLCVKRLNFKVVTTIIFLITQLLFSNTVEIERYLKLPEEKIDMVEALCILSKDAYPNVSSKEIHNTINQIVMGVSNLYKQVNQNAPTKSEDSKRVGSLNTYLYQQGFWNNNQIFINDTSFYSGHNPEAIFFHYLLKTRKGTCPTLPILWYIVADKLKWDVAIVSLPTHYFVSYQGSKLNNIEATKMGGYVSSERYMKDYFLTSESIKKCIYMKRLTKKQLIASLVMNNAIYSYKQKKNLMIAEKYFQIALHYSPNDPSIIYNYGAMKQDLSMINKAIQLGFPKELIPQYKPY